LKLIFIIEYGRILIEIMNQNQFYIIETKLV
jgi:hypothetical protein